MPSRNCPDLLRSYTFPKDEDFLAFERVVEETLRTAKLRPRFAPRPVSSPTKSTERAGAEKLAAPPFRTTWSNALEHNQDDPQCLVSEVPQISSIPFPALRPSGDQSVCVGHPLLLPLDSEW